MYYLPGQEIKNKVHNIGLLARTESDLQQVASEVKTLGGELCDSGCFALHDGQENRAGQRGATVTSASKAGLIGLSEWLMQEVRKYNVRVTSLTPNTIATDLAVDLKLTDGNPEKGMQPEDFAELIVSQLKLNRRVFVKEAGIWSTNP